MDRKKIIQIVIILILLIAMINLGCVMRLFFFKNVNDIYIISSIIVGFLQIAIIFISIILLRNSLNSKLAIVLTIVILTTIVITFFIPVQTYQVYNNADKWGLAPSVIPYKEEINLYDITLYKYMNIEKIY